VIPCHRVIAGEGSLGGYGGGWWGGRAQGLALKRELLRREGVAVPA
jgi:methylated-DNA-[protein]-cysteine S-methyltransferase